MISTRWIEGFRRTSADKSSDVFQLADVSFDGHEQRDGSFADIGGSTGGFTRAVLYITSPLPQGIMGGGTPPEFRHDHGGGTSKTGPDTWGGNPPEKLKIFRKISGQKMIKTRVPECPQSTKLNQNDPQDQGISLGGPLGAQDPPK